LGQGGQGGGDAEEFGGDTGGKGGEDAEELAQDKGGKGGGDAEGDRQEEEGCDEKKKDEKGEEDGEKKEEGEEEEEEEEDDKEEDEAEGEGGGRGRRGRGRRRRRRGRGRWGGGRSSSRERWRCSTWTNRSTVRRPGHCGCKSAGQTRATTPPTLHHALLRWVLSSEMERSGWSWLPVSSPTVGRVCARSTNAARSRWAAVLELSARVGWLGLQGQGQGCKARVGRLALDG